MMKKYLLLAWIIFQAIPVAGQITLSEVMFDPATSESADEFLELYNTADTSVSVVGYVLSVDDAEDAIQVLPDADSVQWEIPPHSFAVILDRDYWDGEQPYTALIPDTVPQFTIADSRFGTYGLSNSSSRSLSLTDSTGTVITTYTYSADNSEGYSDEKILLDGPNTFENWANSQVVFGTPGSSNSVTPKTYDLAIVHSPVWEPQPAAPDSQISLTVTVQNVGLQTSAPTMMIISEQERIDSVEVPSIPPEDSVTVQAAMTLPSGEHLLTALVNYPSDEDTTNNRLQWKLPVRFPRHSCVILEIMYDPYSGNPEWVELYNITGDPVNLYSWRFGDASSSFSLVTDSVILDPGEYRVIAESADLGNYDYNSDDVLLPAEFPNLNNSGDGLYLRDVAGALIDSVEYASDWGGGDGISLERKNPYFSGMQSSNWGSALPGIEGTPTSTNSILADSVSLQLRSLIFPEGPFHTNQTATVQGLITNVGLLPVDISRVQIYDDANYDSVLSDNELSTSLPVESSLTIGDSLAFTLSWEAELSGLRKLDFVCVTNEPETILLADTVAKVFYPENILLINEIMYTPEEQPEWIEIYNAGSNPVNLFGWQIKDATATPAVFQAPDRVVQPSDFILVAADEMVTSFYNHLIAHNVAVPANFPTLNNSADSLLIISPAGRVHDSLEYRSSWGGNTGESLERRNLLLSAVSPENWGTSQSPEGATPVQVNSIAVPNHDLAIADFTADGDGIDQEFRLTVTVTNAGKYEISDYELLFYHDTNEDSMTQSTEFMTREGGEIGLTSGDSAEFEVDISGIGGGYHQMLVTASTPDDDDSSNNSGFLPAYLGYPSESVQINEIMYQPETGEPEWVELVVTADSVDFRGFHLRDQGHNSTIRWQKNNLFAAGDYVVLAGDSTVLQSYPADSIKLILSSGFPTLNNGADSVRIYDGAGRLMEGMEYSSDWGGEAGVSLERRNLNAPVTQSNNWSSSRAPEGATPGAVNSTAILDYDVSLDETSLASLPRHPDPNTVWQLNFQLHNTGLRSVSSFTSLLFHNENSGGAAWHTNNISTDLAPGDSAVYTIDIPGLPSGVHPLLLRIDLQDDLRLSDNSATCTVTVPFGKHSLLITEFIPIPGEGWSEFIEMYNPTHQTIDLTGWAIADNASGSALKQPAELPPNKYAVLAPDSSVFFEFEIPATTPYLIPETWRSLNNSSDEIKLIDPAQRIIDSLAYSADWTLPEGKSLERKWYLSEQGTLGSSDERNWAPSIASGNATPGRKNSVAIVRDSRVEIVRTDSLYAALRGSNIEVQYRVVNTGLQGFSGAGLSAGFDLNSDSLLQNGEQQFQSEISAFDPLDTVMVPVQLTAPQHPGFQTLVFRMEEGEFRQILFDSVWVPYDRQSILLNEFLPDPSQIYPMEFIEVVNVSEDTIPFGNWSFSVNSRTILIDTAISFIPGMYTPIAESHGTTDISNVITPEDWAILPNTGGTIQLFDPFGYLVDSLQYTDSWDLQTGRSLERLHLEPGTHSKSNWRSNVSPNGATPGKRNSLFLDTDSLGTGWTIQPSPFSPNEDGIDDLLQISYTGDSALEFATIRIFDTVGRNIRTLVRDAPAPVQQTWIWDGRDTRNRPAPIGIYIVHIEYETLDGHSDEKIETVVLAKQL